jgi:hypothetical protein
MVGNEMYRLLRQAYELLGQAADYFHTLPCEVHTGFLTQMDEIVTNKFNPQIDLIWPARWSIPKVLFLAVRYYGLVNRPILILLCKHQSSLLILVISILLKRTRLIQDAIQMPSTLSHCKRMLAEITSGLVCAYNQNTKHHAGPKLRPLWLYFSQKASATSLGDAQPVP